MLNNIIDASILRDVENYTELRLQENTLNNVSIDDGVITSNARYEFSGISARVMKSGAYGFSSGTDCSLNGLRKVLKSANNNAEFLAKHIDKPRSVFLKVTPQKNENIACHNLITSQKDIIDFSKEIDSYIELKYPNLLARNVDVYTLNIEKLLATSDSIISHSLLPRSVLNITMTVLDKDGDAISFYESFGGYGFFNEVFLKSEDYYFNIDKIYNNL